MSVTVPAGYDPGRWPPAHEAFGEQGVKIMETSLLDLSDEEQRLLKEVQQGRVFYSRFRYWLQGGGGDVSTTVQQLRARKLVVLPRAGGQRQLSPTCSCALTEAGRALLEQVPA